MCVVHSPAPAPAHSPAPVCCPPPCSYEGLAANELCHVRGVFKYPSGDRYEGEYVENQMSGYGVYVWSDGT